VKFWLDLRQCLINNIGVIDNATLVTRIDDLQLTVDGRQTSCHFVRWKLDSSIKPILTRIEFIELNHTQKQLTDARFAAVSAPPVKSTRCVRQQGRSIQNHKRPPINPYVAWIAEQGLQRLYEGKIVLRTVILCDKHFILETIPASRPVFIGPTDTKWQINVGSKQLI
ncbi:hypothetical protein XEUV315_23775, partial [Xanthomonas euvesicatoria]